MTPDKARLILADFGPFELLDGDDGPIVLNRYGNALWQIHCVPPDMGVDRALLAVLNDSGDTVAASVRVRMQLVRDTIVGLECRREGWRTHALDALDEIERSAKEGPWVPKDSGDTVPEGGARASVGPMPLTSVPPDDVGGRPFQAPEEGGRCLVPPSPASLSPAEAPREPALLAERLRVAIAQRDALLARVVATAEAGCWNAFLKRPGNTQASARCSEGDPCSACRARRLLSTPMMRPLLASIEGS